MVKSSFCILLLSAATSLKGTSAFVSTSQNFHQPGSRGSLAALRAHDNDDVKSVSRRDMLRDTVITAFGTSVAFGPSFEAYASGGATAGGAYLLSAKQRYNKRVTAGITAFLSLSSDVEGGNLKSFKNFFETEDEGGWKDVAAAGYLLANAFRTSSSTPPDKLPSVKKWKAFVAEVEDLKKALKKKDVGSAQTSYKSAVEALDEYLSAVELPSVAELR